MATYVLEAEGDPQRALALLERSLAICSTPLAAFLRADVLADLGQPHAALESYNTGLTMRVLPEALFNKALLLHEMARYDEAFAALGDCEQVIKAAPDSGVVTEKSLVLMHQGRHDDAVRVLEPLLASQHVDSCVLNAACRVLLDAGRATEALVHAQRIVNVLGAPAPSTLENHECYMLANALRAIGREEDAQSLYRRTLKILNQAGPSDKAKVHLRLGVHEQAANLASAALEQRPWHPKVLLVRARALAAIGKIDEAVAATELAATQRPGHAKTQQLLTSFRSFALH